MTPNMAARQSVRRAQHIQEDLLLAAPGDAMDYFVNHSCDPNCETVEEDDRIFIYAVRNTQPGEELLYDYHMELDEPITESAKKKFACHCGASNCRGTMIELQESSE